MNEELRDKIVDILGLETAPDGAPEFLLIRDGDRIVEGVDYSGEVDDLMELFSTALTDALITELQDHVYGCDGGTAQARIAELQSKKGETE